MLCLIVACILFALTSFDLLVYQPAALLVGWFIGWVTSSLVDRNGHPRMVFCKLSMIFLKASQDCRLGGSYDELAVTESLSYTICDFERF